MANPKDTALQGLKQVTFQGTTLRGMLLEAYAFWTIGHIMLIGAIVSFILAAVLATLVGLGLWHAHRTDEETQLLRTKPIPVS